MLNLSYSQLIFCGVHVGHSVKNTLLFASWMLFTIRQRLWIINLMKTMLMFKQAFIVIKYVVENLGPLWFINLNKTMERFIRLAATNCGEFFCSTYWIKGMLSNYLEVSKAYRIASAISENVKNRKAKLFNLNYANWYFTRFSWPRSVFISSALSSPLATREAYCLGIPCLAVVDTDVKSQAINLAIPGNDDSLDSIIFYNELISSYVLLRKFSRVFLWFISVRDKKRLIRFNEWVLAKKPRDILLQNSLNWSSYTVNHNSLYSSTFLFLFSKDYWQNKVVDKLRVLPVNLVMFDIKALLLIFAKSMEKNVNLSTIYFTKINFRDFSLFKKKRKNRYFFRLKRFLSKMILNGHSVYYFLNMKALKRRFLKFGNFHDKNLLNFIRFFFLKKLNLSFFFRNKLNLNWIMQKKKNRFKRKTGRLKWNLLNIFLLFSKAYLNIIFRELGGNNLIFSTTITGFGNVTEFKLAKLKASLRNAFFLAHKNSAILYKSIYIKYVLHNKTVNKNIHISKVLMQNKIWKKKKYLLGFTNKAKRSISNKLNYE